MKLATCPLSTAPYRSSSSRFIYRPRLTAREKMAAAGSRHVTESCGEVNDGAGCHSRGGDGDRSYTHILVDHTRSQARKAGCQASEWCMLPWVFLTSLSGQEKQGHAAWLLTDTWTCADGPARWWILGVCLSACNETPPRPPPKAFPEGTHPCASGLCGSRPNNSPFIALQSVYQRECLNMCTAAACCCTCVEGIITLSYGRR